MSKENAYVKELPKCQDPYQLHLGERRAARYDASLHSPPYSGTWAFLCEECFAVGKGVLGVGLGQRLLLRSAETVVLVDELEKKQSEEKEDPLGG